MLGKWLNRAVNWQALIFWPYRGKFRPPSFSLDVLHFKRQSSHRWCGRSFTVSKAIGLNRDFDILGTELTKDLLCGLLSDTAGVVEHVMRGLGRIHLRIALVKQRSDDLLGVVGVHLAAECFDVKGFVH